MVLAHPLPDADPDVDRIRRARLGDRDALEELINGHRTFVEHVARRFISDHDDIEDVAQETWIRAARALGSLRQETHFRPWLRAITRNACMTFLSRRRLTDSLDDEDVDEPADRASDGPEASTEQRDERRRVWEALGALSDLDRRALYLREVESLPLDEVAQRLGIRKNAAEVRIHRARVRFRQLYEATDVTQPACGMAGIRLALLLDGELHGESAEAIEGHVKSCVVCTQRLRTMAQGRSLYRRMGMFALPGLTGLLERLQRVSDSLMRWIPADAAPVLINNSNAPAAVITGVTTAATAAVVLVAPVLADTGVLDFAVTQAPPPAVIASAPPPDAAAPTFILVTPKNTLAIANVSASPGANIEGAARADTPLDEIVAEIDRPWRKIANVSGDGPGQAASGAWAATMPEVNDTSRTVSGDTSSNKDDDKAVFRSGGPSSQGDDKNKASDRSGSDRGASTSSQGDDKDKANDRSGSDRGASASSKGDDKDKASDRSGRASSKGDDK